MVKKMLIDMMNIESVNPMLPMAPAGSSEKELSKYIASILEREGIDFVFQEVSDGRSNVVAKIEGASSRYSILMSSHMDTYPMIESLSAPSVEKDGIVYGRGACDTKASLACMLSSFLSQKNRKQRNDIFFAATIDEEYGLTGAEALSKMDIQVDLAITGEPTQLIPMLWQKGIARLKVCLSTNKPIHAAYPTKGHNLFVDFSSIVKALENVNAELADTSRECIVGNSTASLTNLESDGLMNMSPTNLFLNFDIRLSESSSIDVIFSILKKHLEESILEPTEIMIEPPYFYSPPNTNDYSSSIIKNFLSTIGIDSVQKQKMAFSYGSEAGHLKAIASHSLVFGPGDPIFSHKENEQIEVEELEKGGKLFEKIVRMGV